ncbi:MAG TPA: PIN domain-containing protein [Terriglobales bacterium]
MIDANVLPAVFDVKNSEHPKFRPVLEWVSGKGFMVYGGTKYINELKRLAKFLGLIAELNRQGRTIQVPAEVVDPIAADLKKRFPEKGFNDEHVAALVIASGCQVVCTSDKRSIKYLKDAKMFASQGARCPKLFTGHSKNAQLCCPKRLVGQCRHR